MDRTCVINPWSICTEASEHSQLGRVVGHYAYQAVCMSPHYIDEAIYDLDMGSVVFFPVMSIFYQYADFFGTDLCPTERNHFIFELVMRRDD